MEIKLLIERIFEIQNETDFKDISLKIFKQQAENNKIYNQYIKHLNIDYQNISQIEEIPFLPISFFKKHKIICGNQDFEEVFISSGTTGMTQSKHYVKDISIYKKSFRLAFEHFYGKPENYCFLALLPAYLERKGSSLIYMADDFIKTSNQNSGFFLNNHSELVEILTFNESNNIKTILLGVSFALLDLAEKYKLNLKNTIIVETGGMKGRRQEITKNELHNKLKNAFGVENIHSEYGMTELLSQAYSSGNNKFKTPKWMKILIRDIYDPFKYLENNKSGGINVIDLANINSCSFIETQDIGKMVEENKFEISGRIDNSEIRGCNLLVMND